MLLQYNRIFRPLPTSLAAHGLSSQAEEVDSEEPLAGLVAAIEEEQAAETEVIQG